MSNPPSANAVEKKLDWNAGFRWPHTVIVGLAVAVAVVGCVGMYFTRQGVSIQVATDVGITLSMLGVVGAVVIFARQSAQGAIESGRHLEFMNKTSDTLGRLETLSTAEKQALAAGVPAEPVEVDGNGSGEGGLTVKIEARATDGSVPDENHAHDEDGDSYPEETLGLKMRDDVIVYDPKDIKIWMLAAVFNNWEKQGSSGRWNLSALRGAAQKKGHFRNSWFLAFADPDTGKLEYYRVSTGGRGKSEPTVTSLTGDMTEEILSKTR